MSKINSEIKYILNNYLEYSNVSLYKIEKDKIITGKTIKNILKNTTSKITEKTIKKLCELPNLKKEDSEKLTVILKSFKKEKTKKTSKKILNEENVLELVDILIEKKILKKLDNYTESYFETRKINSFDSSVGSRTLLRKKIWELNDTMFEKFGDIKMLLDITPKEDKIQMKKGLLSVANNLRLIVTELEKNASEPEELETDIIINFEEE